MLGVENVGSRGVVDDDGILEITANLGKVLWSMSVCVSRTGEKRGLSNLYIVPLVVVTAFAEQSVMYNTVDIKLVKQRVAVLCKLVHHPTKFLDGPVILTFETLAVKTTTS